MKKFVSALFVFAILAALPVVAPAQVDVTIPEIKIPEIKVTVPGVTTTGVTESTEGAISIMENHANKTLSCKGQAVSVMGNHNQLTIEGDCTSLSIMGNHNTITLVRGPSVSILGNHNTLHVDAAGSISLTGNYNKLTYGGGIEGEPSISNLGRDNHVAKGEGAAPAAPVDPKDAE